MLYKIIIFFIHYCCILLYIANCKRAMTIMYSFFRFYPTNDINPKPAPSHLLQDYH